MNIKEELRTVEFGIKHIRQDGLYKLKLPAGEEAAEGRDTLAARAVADRKRASVERLLFLEDRSALIV